MEGILPYLTILVLALIQNISFSVVSRSRNRNNMTYHLIAAFFSNSIWFLTFRQLVRADMTLLLFAPYCVGTMTGSLLGVRVSMWVESMLGASADAHLTKWKVGDVAICSVGFTGIITEPEPREVEYPDGGKAVAWVGVHLVNDMARGVRAGDPWSSRDPQKVK
jgi:hypothetical protein